ncbi:MAG: hypothetical protein RR514_02395, partial [Christensenella sp.]
MYRIAVLKRGLNKLHSVMTDTLKGQCFSTEMLPLGDSRGRMNAITGQNSCGRISAPTGQGFSTEMLPLGEGISADYFV